jgi:hypothetical protein
VKAKLLLHSTSAGFIASTKLRDIIEAMHNGLYKNWYKPFAEDFEKYSRHLRDIRDVVDAACGNKENVPLNGHPPFRGQAEIRDVPQGPIAIFGYIIVVVALAIGVATFVSWNWNWLLQHSGRRGCRRDLHGCHYGYLARSGRQNRPLRH